MLLRCKSLILTKLCCVLATVAAAALGLRGSDGSRPDGSVSLETQPPLDESPDATAESFCVALSGRLLW